VAGELAEDALGEASECSGQSHGCSSTKKIMPLRALLYRAGTGAMQLRRLGTYLRIADRISTYGSRRQEVLTRYREDRKSARRFTRRGAAASFSADKLSVDCVIWDISDGGARLAIALPLADLPQHFTLNLFRDESVQRHCEVVRMDKRFVGVKFTE
jgi:hypothetical protein